MPDPSAPAIVITSVGADQLEAIMAIMRASFSDQYGEAWTEEQCASTFPLPHYEWRLARRNDVAVGFMLIRSVMTESELMLLAVVPAQRERGVGTALITSWVASCTERGVDELHLEVRSGNPAIQLYQSRGFVTVSTRANYYPVRDGVRHDALTMKKSLGLIPI